MHSEISGCLLNSSIDLFSSMLSPVWATNVMGTHTVELLNLFLNPRSSDADFDNFTCMCVTCQLTVFISTPLIVPRSKPPAQITNIPDSFSKFTKINRHFLYKQNREYISFHNCNRPLQNIINYLF
jgi:hypothetical protein